MKFLLPFLTFFLGLVASSPTKHAELGTVKNTFHAMGVADPVTFKLIDRLVELAAAPPASQNVTTNVTVTNRAPHGPEAPQRFILPNGDFKCHSNVKLDFMTVMAATAQLSQQCAAGNMKTRDNWFGTDYWQTTRVFVCNWGGTNNCQLNQMLEAIAEIWGYCNAGTVGGWWKTNHWRKGYGLESYSNSWCDWK